MAAVSSSVNATYDRLGGDRYAGTMPLETRTGRRKGEGDDVEDAIGTRMARLLTGSSDGKADAELSDKKKVANKRSPPKDSSDDEESSSASSSHGTHNWTTHVAPPTWVKEPESESSVDGPVCKSCGRLRRLDKAWEMKQRRAREGSSPASNECLVYVRPNKDEPSYMTMDLEEVKACKDLGLALPPGWTVQFPRAVSGSSAADTSRDGKPPEPTRRIYNPGDDPEVVKSRIQAWARAVALAASASVA